MIKDIYVEKFPKCDICSKEGGIYDCPVKGSRSWANMCADCFKTHGTDSVGSRRTIQPIVEKKNEGQSVVAFVISSMEEILERGVQVVKCPLCDTKKRVESDAHYVYECKCGAKVQTISQC